MKKREIILQTEQVKAILTEAKKYNYGHYLLLKIMTILDLRVGEVVSSEPRFRVLYCEKCGPTTFPSGKCKWCGLANSKPQAEWIRAEPNVPGLLIQDLRDNGIWVKRKGWNRAIHPRPDRFVPLNKEHVGELREYIGKRTEGRIFQLSISRVEQLDRYYAQKAGIVDWRMVHPHRHRHYTTTQIARKYGIAAARDIADHSNVSTTNRYVSELPEDEQRKIMKDIGSLSSG